MTEDHWPEPTRFNLLFRLEKAAKEIETEGANHRWAVTCREASQALHNTQCLVMAARAEPARLTDAGAEEGWTGNKCPHCKGHGLAVDTDSEERSCPKCGGTGDEYGPLPPPPAAAADRGVPGHRVPTTNVEHFARLMLRECDCTQVQLAMRDLLDLRRAALATAPKAEDVRREAIEECAKEAERWAELDIGHVSDRYLQGADAGAAAEAKSIARRIRALADRPAR